MTSPVAVLAALALDVYKSDLPQYWLRSSNQIWFCDALYRDRDISGNTFPKFSVKSCKSLVWKTRFVLTEVMSCRLRERRALQNITFDGLWDLTREWAAWKGQRAIYHRSDDDCKETVVTLLSSLVLTVSRWGESPTQWRIEITSWGMSKKIQK